MSLRNVKLFPVHRIIVFQVNFVFKISGQTQVIFVDTDGLLVFVQNVNIFV
jgi:hypothetical protein